MSNWALLFHLVIFFMLEHYKKRNTFMWFVLVLLILTSFYPYMFADAHFQFLNVKNGYVFQIIYLILITFLLSFQIKKMPTILMLAIVIQSAGLLISFFFHGAIGYLLTLITLALVVGLISLIETKIGIYIFFRYYNKWILLVAILGVITFVLSYIGVSPIYLFENTRNGNTIYSWGIGYTNVYIQDYTNFIRYAGFFDEPGAMGYWGLFAIIINRLFIKDRKIEWGLIISLILCLSFGYIIQILVYLLLFYVIEKRRKGRIIIILSLLIIAFGIYSTKGTDYNSIYESTYGRFDKIEKTSTGINLNDRRSELTNTAKTYFEEKPLMGIGALKWSELPYMSDNPYETLAKDGLFGTFYLYFPLLILLFLGLKYKDYELLKVLIVMFLGFLHRPFHNNLLTFFIVYSILYMYIKIKKTKPLLYGNI